jgi:hypothetical protein
VRPIAAILFSLLAWGCDDDDPVSPPAQSDRVFLINPPTFLNEGQQVQLEAGVRDATGAIDTTAIVAWSSNRPELASIDAAGLLTAHVAAPALGSSDVTLLNPTMVRIRAESGADATEWDVELRGWRYTRAAPGMGFVSPLVMRDSEERFTGSFGSETLAATGAPIRLRLVCSSMQPSAAVVVTLEAPAAMLVPQAISVMLDQDPQRTFSAWSPDVTDSAATRFTLSAADAGAFAMALTQSAAATVDLALVSDPASPVTVNFRVNGFDRFWVGSSALLSECQ